MRTPTAALVMAAALLQSACSAPPAPPPPMAARPVAELGRWQVCSGAEVLGHLVLLEIQDPAGRLPFYRIEDAQGRLLGSATEQGRFRRRVPFQDEEQDLGVWSLARGTAKVFEREGLVQLKPVAAAASARRER